MCVAGACFGTGDGGKTTHWGKLCILSFRHVGLRDGTLVISPGA